MADKRYYWLKMREDFFSSTRIKKLRKIAGGDTYTIIYLKMQLLSIKTGGVLKYAGYESSFAEELALDLDEEPENVAVTLQYLLTYGLAETSDNIEYLLPFAAENIGTESESTKRVRTFREKQRALQCNADVTDCNADETKCNTDIEIRDKSKSKDINKEQEEKENNKEKDDVVDEGLSRVIRLYERIISNFPTSRATELLKGYTEELGADVVCHAIEIAADNNVRKWAYIEKILQDYSRNNYTTIEQVKLNEQLREEERRRMQSGNAGRNYSSNGGTVQPKKDFSQYNLDDDLF